MSARPDLSLLRLEAGIAERMDYGPAGEQYFSLAAPSDLAALLALAAPSRRCVLLSDQVARATLNITPAAWSVLDAAERERTLAFEWELATGLDPQACVRTAQLEAGADEAQPGLEAIGIERSRLERWQALCPGLFVAHPDSIRSAGSDPRSWFAEVRRRLESAELLVLRPARRALPWRAMLVGALALLAVLLLSGRERARQGRAVLALQAELSERRQQSTSRARLELSLRAQQQELARLQALEAERLATRTVRPRLQPEVFLRALDTLARELPAQTQLRSVRLHEEGLELVCISTQARAAEQLRASLMRACPELQPLASELSSVTGAAGGERWRLELRFVAQREGS